MKKRLLVLAVAFELMGGVACVEVGYNYDKEADFSKYKTYKWVDVKGGEQVNQLLENQIKDAVDKHLATKGLKATTGDNADLYVAYQGALSQEKQLTTFDSGYGYGPGWGGRYYGGYYGGGGISTTTTSTINIGTVAVDLYDAAKKQLVWRGMASKEIDAKAEPEKVQKNLDKGMAKLFENYPPKRES